MTFNPIDLTDFPAYLESLTRDDWQPIFGLIPEIEKAEDFGSVEGGEEIEPGVFEFPYSSPSALVSRFEKLAYELNIVIHFNWAGWDEGIELLSGDQTRLDNIDLITCCKLITAILRSNRFCDGALIEFFESGFALRVLRRMEELVG